MRKSVILNQWQGPWPHGDAKIDGRADEGQTSAVRLRACGALGAASVQKGALTQLVDLKKARSLGGGGNLVGEGQEVGGGGSDREGPSPEVPWMGSGWGLDGC